MTTKPPDRPVRRKSRRPDKSTAKATAPGTAAPAPTPAPTPRRPKRQRAAALERVKVAPSARAEAIAAGPGNDPGYWSRDGAELDAAEDAAAARGRRDGW